MLLHNVIIAIDLVHWSIANSFFFIHFLHELTHSSPFGLSILVHFERAIKTQIPPLSSQPFVKIEE